VIEFFAHWFTGKPQVDEPVMTTFLPSNGNALFVFLTPLAEGTENPGATRRLNYAARANSIEELF